MFHISSFNKLTCCFLLAPFYVSANMLAGIRSVIINTRLHDTEWEQTVSVTSQRYEWMTHKSCHEVTTTKCCDWMEVKVEVKKKKAACTSPLWVEARCVRPSSAERVVGWICIHGVSPWENVSLGCNVSHIRSHLEKRLPTSLCSPSLSPPLVLPVHSRTNTHKTHSQTSLIPRLSNCSSAE